MHPLEKVTHPEYYTSERGAWSTELEKLPQSQTFSSTPSKQRRGFSKVPNNTEENSSKRNTAVLDFFPGVSLTRVH